MNGFLIGMAVTLILVAGMWFVYRRNSKGHGGEMHLFSSIERLRAIGELSVYRVMTKEIVTETDHSWGEFGSRYLCWVLSRKKMAMIFEFVIDFRYDLQHSGFDVAETRPGVFSITMPPCDYEVHIRDIRFYDEQGAKLLPWLLPDLLNGFLSGGFSEQDKNRLVDAAKKHAENQALELIGSLQSEVQKSAKSTLESISRAFGADSVECFFTDQKADGIDVALSERLTAG